jgi:hypothetical protein
VTATDARPEKPRERAYLVDEARGLDYITDVEGRGRFARNGEAFIEHLGRGSATEYRVWVRTSAVDDADLFGRYTGPTLDGQDPGCVLVECWFPGTTAAGHRYNPRARWYVRCRTGLTDFDEAKRLAAHLAAQ